MITFKQYFMEQQQKRKTVAIVPGSYKPPHAAHFEMVKDYSKMADEVYVIISAPKAKESVRKTATDIVITPEISKSIWEEYIKAGNLKNVFVEISPSPSPVKAAYDKAEKDLSGCDVIFGASKKGDDWKRWSTVSKYFEKTVPSIKVMDPEEYAVDTKMDGMSASDFRDHLDDPEYCKKFLPKELTDKQIEKIFQLLNNN